MSLVAYAPCTLCRLIALARIKCHIFRAYLSRLSIYLHFSPLISTSSPIFVYSHMIWVNLDNLIQTAQRSSASMHSVLRLIDANRQTIVLIQTYIYTYYIHMHIGHLNSAKQKRQTYCRRTLLKASEHWRLPHFIKIHRNFLILPTIISRVALLCPPVLSMSAMGVALVGSQSCWLV